MSEKKIGVVTHWYDKVSVAVLKLSSPIKAGDQIKVKAGEQVFEDTASSLQIDHESVSAAKPGDEVAIKLSQKAKPGASIFLVKGK